MRRVERKSDYEWNAEARDRERVIERVVRAENTSVGELREARGK